MMEGPLHARASSYDAPERRKLPMPDSIPDPDASPSGRPLDLPLIREFDDRSSLWLLEDPQLLRGLLQILDPPLAR